jgi:hypothetical protein
VPCGRAAGSTLPVRSVNPAFYMVPDGGS